MSHSRGYTLIELVVALAVLALASVLIAQGVRLGLRAWDSVNARLSRVQAVAVTQQLLRGRLSLLYPYSVPSHSEHSITNSYALIGDTDKLSFSAPGPHAQAGQMLRYRVFLDRGDGPGKLKISWQADPGPGGGQGAGSGEEQETLLDDVDLVAFEYFSHGNLGSGEWLRQWQGQSTPPALVRLRLGFAHGAAGDWPTLVVRPRIDIPADCQFDLVSRRCR
jgi:general secretion pathway protein J